jgi:hypothetical protein
MSTMGTGQSARHGARHGIQACAFKSYDGDQLGAIAPIKGITRGYA